jgi:hypothetical protein
MHLDPRVAMLGTAGFWSPRSLSYGVSIFFADCGEENRRPHYQECQDLQLPCPDELWESSFLLEDFTQRSESKHPNGITYTVLSLDLFGTLLPLSR